MIEFLSRRLAAALVTLALATVVVFAVVEVLPGDPALVMQIWVDDRDLVFVTDQIPRISLLSADGQLIGRCRGAINGAHGISGDAEGNLYLAELPPQEITKLERIDA